MKTIRVKSLRALCKVRHFCNTPNGEKVVCMCGAIFCLAAFTSAGLLLLGFVLNAAGIEL
jgi:hypothetical protein